MRGLYFLGLTLILPFFVTNVTSFSQVFVIQAFILLASLGDYPSVSIFIRHIPVLKRVTATSFLYATTRALMYIITSFGLVYLTEAFGHYGLWIIMLPVTMGFLWGIQHFKTLETMKFLEKVE